MGEVAYLGVDFVDVAFKAVLALLFLGIASSAVIQGILINRLRRLYPATWERLGRPRTLPIRISAAGRYFFWKGGYREVEDARVRRSVRLLRVLAFGVVALFVVGIGLVLVGLWQAP